MPNRRFVTVHAPSVSATLLGGLLVVLWIAGGASRADAGGQLIVRLAAWIGILGAILFGPRLDLRVVRAPLLFLFAAALLIVLQLVPLPPALWQALPGRAPLVQAAILSGQSQPWRPVAIVPDAAANALASLVVPFAVLVLAAGATRQERAWLPGVVLALVTASMVIGVLQLAGAGINNPLVNFSPGDVSGTFANRNHFSLLLALGCLTAPAWAFIGKQRPGWRAPFALGLVLVLVLVILGTGSRAGIVLAATGLVIGMLLVRRSIRRTFVRGPRWLFPAVVAGVLAVVAIFALASIAADRAMSVDRVFAMQDVQDMRTRGLPVVLKMIRAHFPVGSGFGGFDPMFRMYEPLSLLKPTFFNHAHNDFAEIVLDGGLPALLLLLLALGWWGWASVRTWRATDTSNAMVARLGSAVLLLILLASIVDYPARTPLVMAVIALAAMWLDGRNDPEVTLPDQAQPL